MTAGGQTQTFALTGGLDLVTPPIQIHPGRVMAGMNYEPRAEGYRRIEGIERFDGRPKPSEATYWSIPFHFGNEVIPVGATVTGGTSGATGYVLLDSVVTSGDFGGGNAAGQLVLADVAGVFQDGEQMLVGGVSKALANGLAVERGADDTDKDKLWLKAAVARRRTLIQQVPGGGPVRGAWIFKGVSYAFRDDAAEAPTKARMYRATAAGWELVNLGYRLPFTAGQAAGIAPGDTITGSTSGATAVVSRFIIRSGDLAANNAAGLLVLSSVAGTFVGETVKVGGTVRATIAAAPTENILQPGGRYEFDNANFYGATYQGAMYGCNGVNAAFEFDGTSFAFISTGAPDERPIHVQQNAKHLFLAYRNGQLTGSQSGVPHGYDGSLGATSFGLGGDITGLQRQPGGTLAVFGRAFISILYGSTADDFVMKEFTDEAGAIEWTLQKVGAPTYMDHGGVRTLSTTQAFGDFKVGALTQLIQPLLDTKRAQGVVPVGALRVRTKGHYRLYFSDGTGFAIYIGAKIASTLPFDYGARVPFTLASCLDGNDEEVLLMGCADGFVYQLDKGTSMDGDPLNAFLRLHFNHSGSPNQNKRYQKITLQADAAPSATLYLTAAFSDGDPDMPSVEEQGFDVRGGGGFWNEAIWNQFYWSTRVKGEAQAHIDGLGNNISLTVGSSSDDEQPHTLYSCTLQFSLRGPRR